MEIEQRLQKLGIAGKWQIIFSVIFFVSLKTFTVWRMLSIIYVGYRPPHHCKIPNNSSLHQWIPVKDNETFSSCSMYDIDSLSDGSVLIPSNRTTNCNNGWTFDLEESGPTVVSKWNLVCERAYLTETSQTILILGKIAAVFLNSLSDKFGRKPTMLIAGVLMAFFGLLSAVVNQIELYFCMKFFIGVFTGASTTFQAIYFSESFSSKGRALYLSLSAAYYGLSAALLSICAYFITNWVYLESFTSICFFCFLPFIIWWLPETITWLYVNGRLKEAEAVFKRISEWNKIKLTDKDLEIFSYKREFNSLECKKFIDSKSPSFEASHEKSKPNPTKYSITLLIRNRYLRRHMSLALLLFLCEFSYSGGCYISGSLSTNRFFSGFITAFIEVPSCIMAYLLCKRFGRRLPIIVYQFLAGTTIFFCIFTTAYEKSVPALSHVSLMLNVLFKLFIAATYAITFFIGSELFPTSLRAQAVGICFTLSRFGGLLATYSSYIIRYYPNILFACFCASSILGGVVTFLLPETSNKPIPTTIKDIEALYDKNTDKKNTC